MRTNVYFCILITNPNFNTMKKLILFAALLLATIAASAQQGYHSDYKYSFFSNIDVGVSGQYAYDLQSKCGNFGADIRATKRIGDHWRLRGIADINGFIRDAKFDRKAKGMLGVSIDFLPFYAFIDYGVVYNPSHASRFGLSADGGIGFNFDIGRGSSLYTEAGADRTNNGNTWESNAFVKVGYSKSLGVTEMDRQGVIIKENQPKVIEQLSTENQLLKTEAKKAQETTAQLQATLEQAQTLFSALEAKLAACSESVKQAEENCVSALPPIYFEYAQSYLTPIEEEKVALIAETIKSDDATYMIEGYCSNNGDHDRNQKLSEERAYTVFLALINYGVNSTRLVVIGNGMSDKDAALEQKVVARKAKR